MNGTECNGNGSGGGARARRSGEVESPVSLVVWGWGGGSLRGGLACKSGRSGAERVVVRKWLGCDLRGFCDNTSVGLKMVWRWLEISFTNGR